MPTTRLIRSTTVLSVRRNGTVVMAGDGQVTLGEGVIKHSAKKIRRLYQDKILAGFAGSTADAFTLFSRFESKLEQYHGNLGRGAVELAKDWRTDKFLRHLEALLLVSQSGLAAYCGGSCNETDRCAQVSANIAMACGAVQVLAKPGMGVDEGMMIVGNEMARVEALVTRRDPRGSVATLPD